MNVALCKCGIDMSEHGDWDDGPPEEQIKKFGHVFDASGTKYPCGESIGGYLCPRPRCHTEHGVGCGPLTGSKLWDEDEDDLPATDDKSKIDKALTTLLEFGQVDGDHHKLWVIDQAVRALTGDRYDEVIAEYCDGDDGPDSYEWDTGIAP